MTDVAFKDQPLADKEAPNFLSKAALRAARKWKDKAVTRPAGSPGFKPTATQAKQVEKMAAMGLSSREIGQILCIEKHLVEFFYEYEIKTATARVNMAVGKACLEMALDKQHPDMTKFWLKSRAGWKETNVLEHQGIDKDADEARAAREKLLGGAIPEPANGGTAEAAQ